MLVKMNGIELCRCLAACLKLALAYHPDERL